MTSDERQDVGRLYSISAWSLAASGEVLVVINTLGIFGQSSAAVYVTAMISLLGVATVNFVAITYRRFFLNLTRCRLLPLRGGSGHQRLPGSNGRYRLVTVPPMRRLSSYEPPPHQIELLTITAEDVIRIRVEFTRVA